MSAFEVRAGESMRAAIPRIAQHEIDTMRAALRTGPRGEAVHEARKSSKKLRALVRLIHHEIGTKRYRRDNRLLRDAVRPLSPLRDAEVLVLALDRLQDRFTRELRPHVFDALRKALTARARMTQRGTQARVAMRQARRRVGRAAAEVATWRVRHGGWKALAVGLRTIYARARKAKRAVEAFPSVDTLHEWRKRSKDLRYVLELLEPIWPAGLKPLVDEVHALTDRLGDDHDLAVLAVAVRDQRVSGAATEDIAALLALIDQRRRALQAEAGLLGAHIFGETPRRFVARLRAYWATWRRQTSNGARRGIAGVDPNEAAMALSA